MAITLSSLVTDLKGIGPSRAKAFERLGIRYVRDLLFHFPRKHEDFSSVTPIKDLQLGRPMTVRGTVKSLKDKSGFYGKRRLLRLYCDIQDETGVLHVVWFNLRFLKDKLTPGTEIYVAGTVEKSKFAPNDFSMRSPSLEFVQRDASQRIHTAAITPLYSETAGISSRFIRYQVKQLFPAIKLVPEYLPEDIIERNDLMGIQEAIESVHFPSSQEQLERAKARLQFDELFFLQLAALVRKKHLEESPAYPILVGSLDVQEYAQQLPFSLTEAQQRAIGEIAEDIGKAHPMNRLLQGDVGSGKSAVALLAAMMTLAAGKKVLYLAPTEILARQQADSFKKYLGEGQTHLLVGAMKPREKSRVISLLTGEEPVCIIGTHALLQEGVVGADIALAIIDEQHRFGVAQRKALLAIEKGYVPHLLSMTATPIPRTLNLTVYGDLEVSVLDELPPGRTPIVTRVLDIEHKDNAIIHMLEELHAGRQAYVIAPVIEDSQVLAVKSARRAYQEIQELFPGIAVGLLHGQMKSEEKEAAMNNFTEGAIQLLVATSVVEVGVNVPNATIMMIEGAERFGLAQLHQFRGRIGRGEHASTCYLVPTNEDGTVSERLQLFATTNNGFEIAEADLRFRGPGEVYGLAQSGFGNLRVASLLDYKMIKLARSEAATILQNDPMLLHHHVLRKKVEQKNSLTHFE
ncbi:MAG: ATP-dependent DNA helicase RecG [Candidatus Andersenbacteria bacterium RIFCSPHIGHO2_01_FULL_46_36]|uniref:Probable DNA 3'-5' helicase RecG n=1 Tax=Candidatus Andersenbacteria bacterium RIFCSPHIGHO2_12_FULL_45_11 TaxID=1797281 RepID=A0A1G1X2H3_9BACT|nr:MAG: ATP-dependent DNA helicase RecG [Candidatus Andersenbacteria bacterium RIFCSPHIGHO2_01_FULL_46_36]OGY34208.1 MAG: ATP-dependent DNA helicase RecG [Candidatus Andersenbacteria bacterium RIFCSPHIGHO2_12_FULL_45_11]